MLPSTPWPRAHSYRSRIYTTSEISGIDIPPSSIAQQMLPHASYHEFRGWRKRQKTRRNDRKKMTIGLRQILLRRMALGADAGVILTFVMWKARKDLASLSGLRLLEVGQALSPRLQGQWNGAGHVLYFLSISRASAIIASIWKHGFEARRFGQESRDEDKG